jgi:hypothetical protein
MRCSVTLVDALGTDSSTRLPPIRCPTQAYNAAALSHGEPKKMATSLATCVVLGSGSSSAMIWSGLCILYQTQKAQTTDLPCLFSPQSPRRPSVPFRDFKMQCFHCAHLVCAQSLKISHVLAIF